MTPRLSARASNLTLLAAAALLLRVRPPHEAHAVMVWIGRWLPELETADDVRRAARSFGRLGSCLSRSLALAARAPAADVVIGVAPRGRAPLFAHAWLEIDGAPVLPNDAAGAPILRLRGRRGTPPVVLPS